jgi:hypothetical protein
VGKLREARADGPAPVAHCEGGWTVPLVDYGRVLDSRRKSHGRGSVYHDSNDVELECGGWKERRVGYTYTSERAGSVVGKWRFAMTSRVCVGFVRWARFLFVRPSSLMRTNLWAPRDYSIHSIRVVSLAITARVGRSKPSQEFFTSLAC